MGGLPANPELFILSVVVASVLETKMTVMNSIDTIGVRKFSDPFLAKERDQ